MHALVAPVLVPPTPQPGPHLNLRPQNKSEAGPYIWPGSSVQFAILPAMFEDDEPYMPYVLVMAGLSVAVFLSLFGGWLIQ